MDVRIIVARTFAFGSIVATIAGIYGFLSLTVAVFFENLVGRQSDIVVSIIVAVLVATGYNPIRKLIEQGTNRFLYKKSYDPDKIIARITEVASSLLDLKSLARSISGTLSDAFHFQKIGLTLIDGNKNFQVIHQEGFAPHVVEKLIGYPGVVDILHKEVTRIGGLLVLDEIKTLYENGEYTPASPKLLEMLIREDIAVVVPLHVKEHLIGIITLGNKKSGDAYNKQDLQVLKIIAGQVAIAIENATLYDELKDFNIKLEEEVDRKTKELKKANEELRQLDKAKSEFISIASHQLRTPLTVIKGYISMILEGSFGKISDVVSENLKKVYESNERLIGLVENLLDLSRIESGRQQYEFRKVDAVKLASTIVENLQNNAKPRGLTMTFHAPKGKVPLVTADEMKLHEVMMNFVDNAIKYTEKGSIDIHIKEEPAGNITFTVKDTGKGFSKELKAQLFKKFSRGGDSFKMHTEGVGLGLYVAKAIIDAHGGKIWAESPGEGKGAEFGFSIPIQNNKATTPAQTKK